MFDLIKWLRSHPDVELSCMYDLPFTNCVFKLRKGSNGVKCCIFSAENPPDPNYLEVVLDELAEKLEREGGENGRD